MCENIYRERSGEEYLQRILSVGLDGLKRMENVDSVSMDSMIYLGELDADKEWNDNPAEARKKFLHTEAYEKFLDERALILLGRTGTGKTAILRCIEEDIKTGKLDRYNHVVKIYFSDIIEELDKCLIIDNSQLTFQNIKKALSMIINIEVIKCIVEAYEADSKQIARYLNDKGIKKKNTTMTWITTAVRELKELNGVSNLGQMA